MTLLWLGGIALVAWSWHVSGSFLAALLATVVGGFFLIVLAGPLVAAAAFVLSLAADLIWPRR
ncbi:MAG: hypothetical protein N2690_04105 [Rhodocyclaceae bacterium]|nr:hypothetical protein [Rhodocyclaceae bacterium]